MTTLWTLLRSSDATKRRSSLEINIQPDTALVRNSIYMRSAGLVQDLVAHCAADELLQFFAT